MSRGSRLFRLHAGFVLAVAAAVSACQAAAPAVSPEGLAVQVSDRPAPFIAKPLGPVTATSGHGCGLSGEQGSREKAVAILREEVASEGGDYVQITSVVTPHIENGCYADQIVVRGLAWRVAPGAPLAPPPVLADTREPTETRTDMGTSLCAPPCGPGYTCDNGACRAVCEPPCGSGEACGQDRVSRPVPIDAGLPAASR
jgi:hypothetical protein